MWWHPALIHVFIRSLADSRTQPFSLLPLCAALGNGPPRWVGRQSLPHGEQLCGVSPMSEVPCNTSTLCAVRGSPAAFCSIFPSSALFAG